MKSKKIATALILALIMIATISSVAFAESAVYATIESDSEVLRGKEIEFYISIGGRGIRGIAVVPIFNNEAFSLVSGSWMVDGMISDFSLEEGNGVIAFASPTDVNGVAFTFTLRVLDSAEFSAQTVNASIIVIDEGGRREIPTEGVTVEVKCDHANINDWESEADSHWQECSCGHKTNAEAHQWNQGTVTKEPTESAEGEKTYTCVICGAKKVESVEMLEENTENGVVYIIVAAIAVVIIAVILVVINKGKIPPASPDTKKDEKVRNLTKREDTKDNKAEPYIEKTTTVEAEETASAPKEVTPTEAEETKSATKEVVPTEAEETKSAPKEVTPTEAEETESAPKEVSTAEDEENEARTEKVDSIEGEKSDDSTEESEPASIEGSESETEEKVNDEVDAKPDTVEDKSIEEVAEAIAKSSDDEALAESAADAEDTTKSDEKAESTSPEKTTETISAEPPSTETIPSTNAEESTKEAPISSDSEEAK